MSRDCKYCGNNIVTDSIKCPKCTALYHPGCVKQTKVLPDGGYQKCCGVKVITTLSDLRSLIREENVGLTADIKKDISDQLQLVINSIGTLAEKVDMNIQLLNNRIVAVEEVNKVLVTNAAALETQVKDNSDTIIKIKNQMATSGAGNDSAILEEVEERLVRRKNVILFGVPESADASKQGREDHDLEQVRKICSALEVDSACASQFRIGKYSPALVKPRPIKLSFDNATFAESMMQSLARLKRSKQIPADLLNVALARDRTVLQRRQQKETWSEFQRRKQNGEANLRIVTRNGSTSIVRTRARHSTPEIVIDNRS